MSNERIPDFLGGRKITISKLIYQDIQALDVPSAINASLVRFLHKLALPGDEPGFELLYAHNNW